MPGVALLLIEFLVLLNALFGCFKTKESLHVRSIYSRFEIEEQRAGTPVFWEWYYVFRHCDKKKGKEVILIFELIEAHPNVSRPQMRISTWLIRRRVCLANLHTRHATSSGVVGWTVTHYYSRVVLEHHLWNLITVAIYPLAVYGNEPYSCHLCWSTSTRVY